MEPPSYADLQSLREMGARHASYAKGIHPNPRFYKYKWRIFWQGSSVEGAAFFRTEPLSISAALDLIGWLESQNESFIVYNTRYPRRGNVIWDADPPRWKGVEFAPAYDADEDPQIESGHR